VSLWLSIFKHPSCHISACSIVSSWAQLFKLFIFKIYLGLKMFKFEMCSYFKKMDLKKFKYEICSNFENFHI
jgi:hypothetical protein